MFQTSLLKDIEPLAEGMLVVLEKVGALFQNEEMLEALEVAGAKVDHALQKATFPREMVLEYVESFRREHLTSGDEGQAQFGRPALATLETQVAQFVHDYEKQERRSGNRQDLITLIKLGDVLHGDSGVGHSLLLTDVPPLLEPLEAAMLLAEYAHRPGPAFAWNVRQVDYLKEMGDILGIKDWFTWGAICIAHPFRFDRDVADKFVRRVREGFPTGLTAMPIAGISTPVTVEGFTVVSSAEHVAAWIAARALNPDVAITGSQWAGTIDMKTGQISYCAFDAMFYAFVCVEFLRRWTGVSIEVGGGEYCDAREPGLYTALEKAYKAMTIAAFSGHHPPIGQGMLEEGKTLSPVQLLLERDLGLGIQHYGRDVEATAENIALPTILEVGSGSRINYLQMEHTLHHYRSCLWLPQFIDRSGWNGAESEKQMLDQIQQKANALIASYRKPEGREEKLSAMRTVVERARRELL